MLLWRLSGTQHAQARDGGYGLHFDGRWNTVGHAVTYCATSPALCVLEKLVHIEDPLLLPDLVMVTYELPDSVSTETLSLDELPLDWRLQEAVTQQQGDAWHEARSTLLLRVPSVIVPIPNSPDLNVLVNHTHSEAAKLKIVASQVFKLDARLL
jgi:RES domain-containing protein